MNTHYGRRLRRSASSLILSGAGIISFDQSMVTHRSSSDAEALGNDWLAVGSDLRHALQDARKQVKVA